jgi:uncharacterized membrane protein YedE/YeeE
MERITPARDNLLWYVVLGCLFGIVLVKSEVVSWFRIHQMFLFQEFHMYGVLGSAVTVAALSLAVLKRIGASAMTGEPICVPPREMGRGYRYGIGGALFGVGWALTGACPGPLFALIGAGSSVFAVVALSAIAGTWTYGLVRPSLPH